MPEPAEIAQAPEDAMRRALAAACSLALVLAGAARADALPWSFRTRLRCQLPCLPSASRRTRRATISLSRTTRRSPRSEQLRYPQLRALWQRAGARYGIPWQVLAAINKVESNFGRNMGPSSAGAIGWMQFMPSTWAALGRRRQRRRRRRPVERRGRDLRCGALPRGARAGPRTSPRAVFSYNHAHWYVDEVLQLAQLFGVGRAWTRRSASTACRSRSATRAPRSSGANRKRRERRGGGRASCGRASTASGAGSRRRRVLSDRLALERKAVQTARPARAAQARRRPACARPLQQAQQQLDSAQRPLAGRLVHARGRDDARPRPPTTAPTSSRSAAAPASSRSRTITTTTRPRTSPRRWGRRSTRSRTRSSSGPGNTRTPAAASA